MTIDFKAAKRRLIIMGVINAICLLVALAAIGVYVGTHLQASLIAFAAALVIGFGAQIWFIASLRRRANEGA